MTYSYSAQTGRPKTASPVNRAIARAHFGYASADSKLNDADFCAETLTRIPLAES